MSMNNEEVIDEDQCFEITREESVAGKRTAKIDAQKSILVVFVLKCNGVIIASHCFVCFSLYH